MIALHYLATVALIMLSGVGIAILAWYWFWVREDIVKYLAKRKLAKINKLTETTKKNSIPEKPTVNSSNLQYYKNARREMVRNREWLVAQTKKYPLCIEIEGFYWCVDSRADVNRAIKQLSQEIRKVEHPEGFPEEFAKNVSKIMKTTKRRKQQ